VLWLGDPWASAAQPKVGKALEKLRRKHKNSFKIIYPVVLVIKQESVSGITIFSEGGLPALSLTAWLLSRLETNLVRSIISWKRDRALLRRQNREHLSRQ
jgi:hypothetical protein